MDPTGGHPVEDGRGALAPARRLQRALCVSPAGGSGVRGARLRHPLHQQRHRLPARSVCERCRRSGGGDASARSRGGRALRQQRRRLADGAHPEGARMRRWLRRSRGASRRGRVHGAGHRSIGGRRERSARGRARARHVRHRQRLAPLARALHVRSRLARPLPRSTARTRRPHRCDRACFHRRCPTGARPHEGARPEDRSDGLASRARAVSTPST